MKLSVRALAIGFAAAILGTVSLGASQALAFPVDSGEITLDKHAIQIIKGLQAPWVPGTSNDTLNLKITFTNHGDPGCDIGDSDVIGQGLGFSIAPGTCAQNYYTAITVTIGASTFVPKTVGGVKIGTLFAVLGASNVAAKVTTQTTPIGACGKWTLEFQATKLDLYKLQHNPIALRVFDADGSASSCNDINDALIGAGF